MAAWLALSLSKAHVPAPTPVTRARPGAPRTPAGREVGGP
jgi:hypothetical protein